MSLWIQLRHVPIEQYHLASRWSNTTWEQKKFNQNKNQKDPKTDWSMPYINRFPNSSLNIYDFPADPSSRTNCDEKPISNSATVERLGYRSQTDVEGTDTEAVNKGYYNKQTSDLTYVRVTNAELLEKLLVIRSAERALA